MKELSSGKCKDEGGCGEIQHDIPRCYSPVLYILISSIFYISFPLNSSSPLSLLFARTIM